MTFINKQYEAYLAYLKTLETFLVNKKQGNINSAKTHMNLCITVIGILYM